MITERSQMKICGLSFVCLSPIGSHRDHFEVLHLSFISNRVAPGPRRGHTMVTAGLDPRVIEISCIYDPKGVAHHHASSRRIGILVAVRPLWGRGVGIEPIHRGS